ncbi:MAG TPA: DEAD/DEAH box helicase [Puia sp.]|nr:DEAD/DEAH box helicase [Puia sp.]
MPTGPAGKKESPFVPGILLNFNQEKRGGLAVEILLVMEKKDGRSYQRIPLSGHHYKAYLQAFPPAVGAVLRQLTDEALIGCLVRGGYAWLQDAERPFERLDERHYGLLREWVGRVLQDLKPLAPAIRHLYYLPAGEAFFSYSVRPAAISVATPALLFRLERSGIRLALRCSVEVDRGVFPLEEFQQVTYFLKSGNEFFIPRVQDLEVLERLKAGELQVREEGLPRFMAMVLRPLAEKYPVDLSEVIKTEMVDELPMGRVDVSELNENFLLIKPKWLYADLEVEDGGEEETRIEGEGKVWVIRRKKEEEAKLKDMLRELHPKFGSQDNGYFYLNFKDALEKRWFLTFYRRMQEADIPVLGMNKLRKFKYNTNTPVFEVVAARGIDWFDLTIRVSYGDQVVPLHELRKAILGKQDFILLADGSLGMVPKEWAEKYGLLLRIGQERAGGLRLPALHWAVLAETGLGSADDALRRELEEKRQRWEGSDVQRVWPVPAAVQAQLRDYQLGGFQWMCLLDEMGWGGCLADDMGLGKTLQTLSFLRHVVERYPEEAHLVVCPTSLLYNWEAEMKKFVPDLEGYLYYGPSRVLTSEVARRVRVVLTSYGVLRSDIDELAGRRWGYVILDESQAIKNPSSLARKAVQRLQSRNRIALSGTPVQNSTFDLYAQMDFLNPGMLGSQEFFRTQFATPVDRNGDKEAAARLRKLVYPFVLRRTKEQVARDLPDKTEMILWCEMGEVQRRIYDKFKESYRAVLLDRIGEDGMAKSSIYILEGLTKLRQICDSPMLIKGGVPEGGGGMSDEGGGGTAGLPNVSAKLEELIREIEEIAAAGGPVVGSAGHHKALVFSQFTSMLKLIRAELDERGIPYLYLDGSVAAEERKRAVAQFQEEEDTRIFLISLKAGGVGLTLTAADYVYLVDPWWNPAVEQQAIDRSHRIGQEKKVFAYRMICRDTVEEKILQLQERKKSLASDLIADEAGFVKQLTKEDVDYLFS